MQLQNWYVISVILLGHLLLDFKRQRYFFLLHVTPFSKRTPLSIFPIFCTSFHALEQDGICRLFTKTLVVLENIFNHMLNTNIQNKGSENVISGIDGILVKSYGKM